MQASIKANPTYTETIAISRPGAEPMKFKGIFKHRTKDEYLAMAKESDEKPRDDVAEVMNVLVGWEDMAEPFSRENVTILLQNFHTAAYDIAATYVRTLGAARLGN